MHWRADKKNVYLVNDASSSVNKIRRKTQELIVSDIYLFLKLLGLDIPKGLPRKDATVYISPDNLDIFID